MKRPAFLGSPERQRLAGFTLPEMLIASTLFLLLLGGIVSANLFGLRMMQITQNKLDVSDRSRKVIGQMTDEIRNCDSVYVGGVSNGTFVAVLDGEVESGSGVLIYPTTNTAKFISYYVNNTDHTLRRSTATSGSTTVMVWNVTNRVAFWAEDYSGQVLTNTQNTRVIHMKVQSYRPRSQQLPADYYQIETAITPRASD